mmetsp:Transcript_18101/g.31172  ORF Transcript_18101/g.31172 Transcript_18101/m.31172 type:complete len:84 (-) Transcript_18101:568-819(-)
MCNGRDPHILPAIFHTLEKKMTKTIKSTFPPQSYTTSTSNTKKEGSPWPTLGRIEARCEQLLEMHPCDMLNVAEASHETLSLL